MASSFETTMGIQGRAEHYSQMENGLGFSIDVADLLGWP